MLFRGPKRSWAKNMNQLKQTEITETGFNW